MKTIIRPGFVFILLIASMMPVSTSLATKCDAAIELDQPECRTLSEAQMNYFEQKIIAPDPDELDEFGISVAISGDTAVIGADKDDVGYHPMQGSAYIYIRMGNMWTFQRKLTASDGESEDGFGYSVAIDGDTVVVGAPYDEVGAVENQGSVYVFVRNAGAWTQQAKLNHPNGANNDQFGIAVAIQDDFVIVGAPWYDYNAIQNMGAAFVFDRSGSNWFYLSRLINVNGKTNDMAGYSVGLDGVWFLVGAPYYDKLSNTDQGAVYAFYYEWDFYLDEILIDSSGNASDRFGTAVAIKSGRALIGAWGAMESRGQVCSFVLSGYDWYQSGTLFASDGAAGDRFGISVAIERSAAVIGATGYRQGVSDWEGTAYIFTPTTSGWLQKAKLTASDGEGYSFFGNSVAVSQGTFLIGAFGDDIGMNANQGSAYSYSSSEIYLPLVTR